MQRAEFFAKRLESTLAVIIKRRPEPDVSEVTHIVGDVEGKIAVVVDDMISTGGTLVKAAEAIQARGATEVYTLATHGIFAGDAVRVLEAVGDREGHRHQHDSRLPTASAHPQVRAALDRANFADTISRITANRSVSELFEGEEGTASPEPGPRETAAALIEAGDG